MKFTVDISESWVEENEDGVRLEAVLKRDIIYQVRSQIMGLIKDQVNKEIADVVKAELEATLKAKIEATTTALIQSGNIMISNKEIKLTDYIKQQFEGNIGWQHPIESLRKLANQFGAELKARYDVAFANQIVIKINEQGMLKDEVVKLLLNKD